MFGKFLSLVIICLLVWAGFERIRRKLGFGGRQKPAPLPFVTLGRIRLSKMEAGIALVIGLYILLSLDRFSQADFPQKLFVIRQPMSFAG